MKMILFVWMLALFGSFSFFWAFLAGFLFSSTDGKEAGLPL